MSAFCPGAAADAIAMLQNSESIALIDPESYDAIFFAGEEYLWPAPSSFDLQSSSMHMSFCAAKIGATMEGAQPSCRHHVVCERPACLAQVKQR